MPGIKNLFYSSAPNWAMTLISVLMLADYIGRIEIAASDKGTAYVAFAWAVMLSIWLSTAIYTAWGRNRSKPENRLR